MVRSVGTGVATDAMFMQSRYMLAIFVLLLVSWLLPSKAHANPIAVGGSCVQVTNPNGGSAWISTDYNITYSSLEQCNAIDRNPANFFETTIDGCDFSTRDCILSFGQIDTTNYTAGTLAGSTSAGNCVLTGEGCNSATAIYPSNGHASASVSGTTLGGPNQEVTCLDGSICPIQTRFFGPSVAAQANVIYSLFVAGPEGTSVQVPLDFSVTGSASASGPNAYSIAAVELFPAPTNETYTASQGLPNTAVTVASACANTNPLTSPVGSLPELTNCSNTSAFDGTFVESVNANEDYIVDIETYGGWISEGPASYSAFADPDVTIDPNFADPSEFSLAFSPGVPTPGEATVPEPATLGLMGLGLLGIRTMRKRKLN